MTFASITSVDDDVETKQAVQKVGNKTIYDGIDTKLIQLKEEHFSEEAIQNYNTLWQPLFNAKTENQKYGISLAKTGASFNDNSKIGRGNQQLIYCANPSKKTLGMKFWVKKNTDNVKAIYNELSTTYSLQDNQNFKIDTKTKDLICESALCLDLGSKYHSFLQAVTKMILQ